MSTTHNPKRDTTPFDPSFACLSSENPQAIQAALDRLIATHSPANPHELSCLHRIALAEVRYFRAIAQETALLELALAESAPDLDSKFKHLDAPPAPPSPNNPSRLATPPSKPSAANKDASAANPNPPSAPSYFSRSNAQNRNARPASILAAPPHQRAADRSRMAKASLLPATPGRLEAGVSRLASAAASCMRQVNS